MAVLGELAVRLVGQDGGFAATLQKADKDLASLRSQAQASGVQVGGLATRFAAAKVALSAFTGALSVGALVAMTREALEFAGALNDASQAAGVGVESLQELRFAASQSGVEADNLDKALARLTKRIGEAAAGEEEAAQAFEDIGVAITDVHGELKPTEVVLREVADAIKELPTPAEQAAASVALFGKEGVKLLEFLRSGSEEMDNWAAKARALGVVIDADLIAKGDAAGDAIARLAETLKVQGYLGFLKLAEGITAAIEKLESFIVATRQAAAESDRSRDLVVSSLDARERADTLRSNQAKIDRFKRLQAEGREDFPGQAVLEIDRLEQENDRLRIEAQDQADAGREGLPARSRTAGGNTGASIEAKLARKAAKGAGGSGGKSEEEKEQERLVRLAERQVGLAQTKIEKVDEEIALVEDLHQRGLINSETASRRLFDLEKQREEIQKKAEGEVSTLNDFLAKGLETAGDGFLRALQDGKLEAKELGGILLQAASQFVAEMAKAAFSKEGGGLSGLLGGIFGGGGGEGGGGIGGALSDVGDFFSNLFADGGVMTSGGRVPLRRYAGGGIAHSPQLAMFGEGSVPEAYVPVPSGKIPVEFAGAAPGATGGMVTNVYQSFDFSGANPATILALRQEADRIKRETLAQVPGVVSSQANRGGSFAKDVGRRG